MKKHLMPTFVCCSCIDGRNSKMNLNQYCLLQSIVLIGCTFGTKFCMRGNNWGNA